MPLREEYVADGAPDKNASFTPVASTARRSNLGAIAFAMLTSFLRYNNLKENYEILSRSPRELFDHEIDFLDMNLNSSAFGVEPIQYFHNRATQFLQLLQQSYPNDASILIVSSNGLMKRIASILTNVQPGVIPRFQNAEIYEYELLW